MVNQEIFELTKILIQIEEHARLFIDGEGLEYLFFWL
jgi:hypothetical protein